MVLRKTTSQNDHSRFFCFHRYLVDGFDILDQIYNKIIFIGVSEENISNRTISETWTENRNLIFPSPVVDTFFVVYLFPHPVDNSRGSPNLVWVHLLFFKEFGKKGQQKTFQLNVIFIGNQDISNAAVSI